MYDKYYKSARGHQSRVALCNSRRECFKQILNKFIQKILKIEKSNRKPVALRILVVSGRECPYDMP